MWIGVAQCAPIEVTTSMEDTPEMTTILPSSISMDNEMESSNKTQKLEEEPSYSIDVKQSLGSHHAENYAKSSYFIPVEVRFDEPRDFPNSQTSPENSQISGDQHTVQTTTINEFPALLNGSESITELRFGKSNNFSNTQISPENPPTSGDENTDRTTIINEISASPNVSESTTELLVSENSNSQNQTENPQKIPTQNSGEISTEITTSGIFTSENSLEGLLSDSQSEGQNSQIFPENPHNYQQENLADITTKSDIPELQHNPEVVTESMQNETSDSQKENENPQNPNKNSPISTEQNFRDLATTNETPVPLNTLEGITEPFKLENSDSQNLNKNPQNSNENPQTPFDQKLADVTTTNKTPVPLNTLEGITEPFKIENSDFQSQSENPQNQSENPQTSFDQQLSDITTTNETPVPLNTLEGITEPFKIENSDSQSQSENPQNHYENTQKSPMSYSNENQEEIEKSVITEKKLDSSEEISKSSEEKQKSGYFPTGNENPQSIISKLSENESSTETKSETEIKFPEMPQIISNNQNNMATLNVSQENENLQDEILKAVESGNPIEFPTTTPESSTLRNDGENSSNIPELPYDAVQKAEENNAATENLTEKDLIMGIIELYNFDSQPSTENPQASREKLFEDVAATVMEIPNETGRNYDINIRSTQSEIPDQMAVESQNSGNPQKIPESVMESLSNSATNLGSDELPSTTQVVEIVKEIPDMPVNDSQITESPNVTNIIISTNLAVETAPVTKQHGNTQEYENPQVSTENAQNVPDFSEKNNFPEEKKEDNFHHNENSSENSKVEKTETHFTVQNPENMNSQNISENPQISPESQNTSNESISNNSAIETAAETKQNENAQNFMENTHDFPGLPYNMPDKIYVQVIEEPVIIQSFPTTASPILDHSTEILSVSQENLTIPKDMLPENLPSDNPPASPENPTMPAQMVILTEAETSSSPNIEKSEEKLKNINFNAQLSTESSQDAGVYMLMEMIVPAESVQEMPSTEQENSTQFLEKSQSREAKSLEIKPQEFQQTEEKNISLEENIGEESMLATQVATTDDLTNAAYENPGFINLNDNMDIMDSSFPTSTSESGVTEIQQNSGENQTNGEISTTNAPSILSEDSLSTAKFEEVALMNEDPTTPKAAAASMTTESSTKPNIVAETTLPTIEVTKQETLQTTTEKMEKQATTMLPDSTTTMPSDTNGNTESTNTEMGEEPTATTINQFASLLAETEMNVHKAFETLREWIAHGQKLEDTTRNPGASDGLEATTNNPSIKDMTTMKSSEDTTNGNGENVTDMATLMHDNENSKDIKENNTEIPNTTMNSSTDDAMDKKHSSGQDEITSTTEGSSSDMEIKETSTGVADHTATTTEQGVAETTIVPTLARVKLEKDLTSINLTYLDDSSEEEIENDRSKEHQKLNSHSNSQENSQEIKNTHTTENSDMEASTGITEMVKFIQHETTTAASDQEERKTLQPLTQASFMEEQQQQIETTTVKDISSPSTSTADEKEEEATEMFMMLLTTTPTTPAESSTITGKDGDLTESSNVALTATTEVPETTESSTNVVTTTHESDKTATDSISTPASEVTTHLPDTTTPDLQETSTTTTDISIDTTTLNPEEDEEFITTTMTTEEPEIETTTLLTTTVALEPRSLPPPKLEYLQSEDGVEVFYGYSIVKHN
ncbi:mucin-2-like [Musca domestica]|uniref:Mucin-2-like n=1 Tax=Musca domestica TaxID=7370 RepID=A0ABM3VKE9_MUSDO|nr:mucin-2-like [Musca domestica]